MRLQPALSSHPHREASHPSLAIVTAALLRGSEGTLLVRVPPDRG